MKMGPYYYETHIYWKGRRRGLVEVSELPSITTSAPPEFEGEPGFWTPEHLLVAAVETCLMTTFLAIAEKSRLPIVSYRSSTLAKLAAVEGAGLGFTKLTVRPVIKVEREEDREKAERLLAKAEKHCFVSNALKTPVQLEPSVEVRDERVGAVVEQVA
jgi:peroxiredoxin-like protein